MDPALSTAFDFIAFTARLREVERHNNATATRRESVAEHSWHLAIVAWTLHGIFERETGTSLDLPRMLKMCLMHDIVEIDAGDPSAWDPAASPDKARIEEEVAQRRFGALDDLLRCELLALWHEYEAGTTLESRLVRGVDRLNPTLMRCLTGQGWGEIPGADTAALDRLQLPRIRVSTALTEIYQHLRDTAVADGLLPAAPVEKGSEEPC